MSNRLNLDPFAVFICLWHKQRLERALIDCRTSLQNCGCVGQGPGDFPPPGGNGGQQPGDFPPPGGGGSGQQAGGFPPDDEELRVFAAFEESPGSEQALADLMKWCAGGNDKLRKKLRECMKCKKKMEAALKCRAEILE